MPVAYSYIRFSTSEQKKGDSLRRQIELSEKYAAQNGLTLDTSLHLHDLGLSAYDRSNVERGALGGFLEAIKLGRIVRGSYLLVESLDRLSRAQVLDALEIFISILRQGITIVTLADGMVYNTDSVRGNFGNLIISITIMARAHEESAMKSRRIRAAWKNKRSQITERKLTAQCPRWMRLDADKTKFELIPERVELVMGIMQLAKNGMGQAQIAKRLNEKGVSPFSNHGKGWHSSYIQKILTSTSLYGELQPHVWEHGKVIPHGEPVPNYYPALITKEEFHLLQNVRSQRAVGGAKARKGIDVPNLLSGVVKCGYCGRTMILAGAASRIAGSTAEDKAKRQATKALMCDGGRRGLGCYAVQWNYKDIETSFLTFCRGLELETLLNNTDGIQNEKLRQLTIEERLQVTESELAEKKRRLQRLIEAVELGDAPSGIVTRIRELEVEVDGLTTLKDQLELDLHDINALNKNHAAEAESIRELIKRLGSLEGDKLYTVRVALAERIRRLIQVVHVYPAGSLVTPAKIQELRKQLLDAGYSMEHVDAYIAETQRTEPERQGRGPRGRYVSRKDLGRHFTIRTKNDGFRVVYPDFEDPSKVVVEIGIRGA